MLGTKFIFTNTFLFSYKAFDTTPEILNVHIPLIPSSVNWISPLSSITFLLSINKLILASFLTPAHSFIDLSFVFNPTKAGNTLFTL